MITQVELGQRIRQARDNIGMSQRDFSDAVGKDQTAISEYETGKRKVPAVELSIFAHVLQVPVSYFYEGDIQPDDLEHILLREFRGLPTADAKQHVLQMVRALSTLLKQQPNQE